MHTNYLSKLFLFFMGKISRFTAFSWHFKMDYIRRLHSNARMKPIPPLLLLALLVSSLVGPAYAGDQTKAASADNPSPAPAAAPAAAAAPDPVWLATAIAAYPLDTCVVGGDKLGGDMGPPVNYVF